MVAILFRARCVNPSGDKSKIYHDNYIKTMGADPLAPGIVRSATTIALNMRYKYR